MADGSTTQQAPRLDIDAEILEAIFTNQDEDIYSLSLQQPVLLVFLRHFGCTFCREALHDIEAVREALRAQGIKIVLVHMSKEAVASRHFLKYDLGDIAHVSDPELTLYELFGLKKGNLGQIFGLKAIKGYLNAGIKKGYGIGVIPRGNPFQMPGVFVVYKGQVCSRFVHRSAADRPDYTALLKNLNDPNEAA